MRTQPLIIAAVDLDHCATTIIEQAAHLATLCQGQLTLVHIVDYPGGCEADHPVPVRPGQVLADMTRHARASLVGMIHHLDLPIDAVRVRVETGPLVDTLAGLVAEVQPRYLLIGPRRLGPLSPSAGFASAISPHSACEILVVPAGARPRRRELLSRIRHWFAGGEAIPRAHAQ